MHAPLLPFDPAGLSLDSKGGLGRQLYQQLRARILDGRLASGVRMPASRVLAKALGISRNSVMRAYDQLFAEGFIEGRVGDGTYVSQLVSSGVKQSTKPSTAFNPQLSTELSTDEGGANHRAGLLAAQKKAALPPLGIPRTGPPRAFRVGIPAIDLFPFQTWSKLNAAFWRSPPLSRLGYQHPAGDETLRELIAAYLRSSRGLNCSAEQILLTCGAQHGIELCSQVLLGPDDHVAVENPGYRAAALALASRGATVHGVAVDAQGLEVDRLAALPQCRLAYVTPAHQYPSGGTLSLPRRLALLEWAQHRQGWILEDDYDGEYRYSGAPLAPLAALDRAGRVIYIGTFGKIAFPALRLGYLVLPPALVEAFVQRSACSVRHHEASTQRVMAQFIADGHFHRHIRRMRKAAASRRDALLAHWPQAIPGCAPMPAVDAGLHVAVRVQSQAREAQLIAQAAAVGVEINPLSANAWPPGQTAAKELAGLVMGFAGVDETAIADACQRLRNAWRR